MKIIEIYDRNNILLSMLIVKNLEGDDFILHFHLPSGERGYVKSKEYKPESEETE